VQSGIAPTWSPQGDWILYGDNGLKLIAEDGRNVRDLRLRALCAFASDGDHLYCLNAPESDGSRRLRDLDLEGNLIREIGSVANEDAPASSFGVGLSLSITPDGMNVTYAVQRSSANLSMLEGLDTVPLP